MKKFEDRGITLIALVVTIIVLIILAGVSISLVLGQDGVVQKAKEGRDSYAEAARIENEQLANVDSFAMSVQEMTPSTSTVTGEITNMTDGEIEISATVNLEGNIDLTKTKYVFTTSNSPLGTNDESLYKDGTIEEANSTITKSKAAGTYYLHVLTTSINGAKKEIISEGAATSQGKKDFDYTGNAQDITLTPGNYKLEVWGASGAGGAQSDTPAPGGKGGYSYGILKINTNTAVYTYVGGQGNVSSSTSTSNNTSNAIAGGWNGGAGLLSGRSDTMYKGSAGGATDISLYGTLNSTDWNNTNHLYSRIIVAGGGGSSGWGSSNGCGHGRRWWRN